MLKPNRTVAVAGLQGRRHTLSQGDTAPRPVAAEETAAVETASAAKPIRRAGSKSTDSVKE